MGDRGNIILKQEKGGKIYFYSHWGGSQLKETLANALLRGKERWGDEPYLSRIIFSEMIKDQVMELTGFGITTYMTDGEDQCVTVDMSEQKVGRLSFQEFVDKYATK